MGTISYNETFLNQALLDHINDVTFEARELEMTTIETIILLILWILVQVIGNALLFGLIIYEHQGNDPLKRRIIDQVSFCLVKRFLFYLVNLFMCFRCIQQIMVSYW